MGPALSRAPAWLAPTILLAVLLGPAAGSSAGREARGRESGLDPDDPMQQVLDKSFKKLARLRNKEALRHHDEGDYPRALAAFREAQELDPTDPEIANNLAFLLHTLGNHAQAQTYYELALKLDPERYRAHINLADLLAMKGDLEETLARAAYHLVKARELKGNKPSVILRQARVATRRGRFHEAELFYREYLDIEKPSPDRCLELGDFYRDFGRTGEASRWYKQVTDDSETGRLAAQRLWELAARHQARRFGWTPRQDEVPSMARELAARGRIQRRQGNLEEAEKLLREAVTLAPHYAHARASLGDVLADQGRSRAAEMEFLRALAVDSRNAENHVRLGDLYLADPDQDRAAEAALFLSHALQLRPEWTSLRLKLARAHQASGNLENALTQVNLFLVDQIGEEERREAQLLKRALMRVLRDDETLNAGENPDEPSPEAPDSLVLEILNRARAYMGQGRIDSAMAELGTLPADKWGPQALSLKGRIMHASGRDREALEAFAASLAHTPGQAEPHEIMGEILLGLGNSGQARHHFRAAEELGSLTATFYLVRLDLTPGGGLAARVKDLVSPGHLLELRDRLDRYLAQGHNAVYYEEATQLRNQVAARLGTILITATVILVVLFVALLLVWLRLRGGSDLSELVRKHPEAGPEVQRVLAAIRHEVLKHNTMVLTGLVEALEEGGDAARKAEHLRDSLFGATREEAVLGHLLTYISQLEQIGRSHGMRLNLKRRDPALAAIQKGFALLEGAAEDLYRVAFLTSAQRARLLRTLKDATRLLNVQGYEAVRDLLDRLRILQVDRDMLAAVFRRIRREPALSGLNIAPPEYRMDAELPCGILVPRPAFEDILGNLIRNAILSSAAHQDEAILVGLEVADHMDAITGLESVVFVVKDCSPRVLTTEMIRGRYIEGGLGLSADLVARFEGTIDVVQPGPPWTKGVAVRLPRAHAPTTSGKE